MNMYEFLMRASMMVSSKDEFGRMMHDDKLSDEEKLKILEQVEMVGGYDNLSD